MLSQLWPFVLEGWGQQPALQAEWLWHQADVQHLVRGDVRKNVHHAVEPLAKKKHSSLNPFKTLSQPVPPENHFKASLSKNQKYWNQSGLHTILEPIW